LSDRTRNIFPAIYLGFASFGAALLEVKAKFTLTCSHVSLFTPHTQKSDALVWWMNMHP